MDRDEYLSRLEKLLSEHGRQIVELKSEYVLSNRIASVGDMVSSDTVSIIVDSFRMGTDRRGMPMCIYEGVRVMSSGRLFTPGQRGIVMGSDVVRVIKDDGDG